MNPKKLPSRNLIALFVALILALPFSAQAQTDPIEDYKDRLENLANNFGIEVGDLPTFDEPGFNRLLSRARRALESAIRRADAGRIRSSSQSLVKCIALLDRATAYGAARNMSGTGFSDDLASFGVSIIGDLCRGLTDELAMDPSAPAWVIDYLDEIAETAYEISREAISKESEGEYTQAALYYNWGIAINLWLL